MFWMPSIIAIMRAVKDRYPHAEGSGQRNSTRLAFGLGLYIGMRQAAERLHDELTAAGFEVLLDDRDERPGIMFADMELAGIPHRIVIGERGLKDGNVEYQARVETKARAVSLAEAVEFMKSELSSS